LVGPDFWEFLPEALQHFFGEVAGQYDGGSVQPNQWNQDPHPSSHVQHHLSLTQLGRRNNLAQTFHHVRRLGSIEDMHQFIETAALVGCH
jgi:hypothetical protein